MRATIARSWRSSSMASMCPMSTDRGGAFTKLPLGIGAQSGENGGVARGGRRGERGSVLILVPAGVLVLMLLGAIAVDFSVAYLAKRQLEAAAGAAVNDAAGAGLDERALRG